MELYQLRTFVAVAEEGQVTRAAEKLHISQPAVSGQLKSLEEALGLVLFKRVHGGIQLTKAGNSLLSKTKDVLAAVEELRSAAKKLSTNLTGRLTLGVMLNPQFIRLGELTNHLLVHYPGLDVDIRHRNSIAVITNLRSQEIDASFYIGQEVPPDMQSIELRKVFYRVVASPVWKDKLANPEWSAVANLPWITSDGSFAQMMEALFCSRGSRPKTIIKADQESTIIGLVQSGVGLSLVREELALQAAARGQLVIWENTMTQLVLKLIYLASREADPVIETVANAVSSVWETASQEDSSSPESSSVGSITTLDQIASTPILADCTIREWGKSNRESHGISTGVRFRKK